MTLPELLARFAEHRDAEHGHFERVSPQQATRPDLHAFLLLDALVPGVDDIVSCATHDEIYLGVPVADLAAVITNEQVVELVRCGVWADGDGLSLFV